MKCMNNLMRLFKHESNPYPIMKPVRMQITGFIVFE